MRDYLFCLSILAFRSWIKSSGLLNIAARGARFYNHRYTTYNVTKVITCICRAADNAFFCKESCDHLNHTLSPGTDNATVRNKSQSSCGHPLPSIITRYPSCNDNATVRTEPKDSRMIPERSFYLAYYRINHSFIYKEL